MKIRLAHSPRLLVLALAVLGSGAALGAQGPGAPQRTPENLYRAACITCHGPDGTGAPKSIVGFDAPLPDFTDCAFATAEADDALSPDEIALAVSHVRTFCHDPSWPRGDLNLPRAFFTEKAFPENEVVWATAVTTRDDRAVSNDLVYERRIGARNQVELVAPLTFQQDAAGQWNRGLGDVAVAFKRVVHSSLPAGRIAAAGMEVVLPTGKEAEGLGNGYTVFEPFAMYGQLLPRNSFVQVHGGVELPSDRSKAPREVFLRTAAGTTLAQDRGFGRSWSPQIELLWARAEHGPSDWDVVPQLQVSLSKIQHVSVAGGVRLPLTQRDDRSP